MGKPEFQIIKPLNPLLKTKRGGGKFTMDYEAIERADAAIATFGEDFHKWGLADIEELEKSLDLARQNPNEQEFYISNIFQRAMDLKSQGGSFDFVLITEIGDCLKQFTEKRKNIDTRDVEIIAAHVDAMKVVLTQNIRGEGGEIGRAIIAGLRQLTKNT